MMIGHQKQAELKKVQQFRRYIRKSYFAYISFHCDLDPEDSKPIFFEDNLTQDEVSPYWVW